MANAKSTFHLSDRILRFMQVLSSDTLNFPHDPESATCRTAPSHSSSNVVVCALPTTDQNSIEAGSGQSNCFPTRVNVDGQEIAGAMEVFNVMNHV